MDITKVFWDLAVILLATKLLGMLMRKLGLPQVVGAVIAGLLIGPAIWGQFGWWSHNDRSRRARNYACRNFLPSLSYSFKASFQKR